MGSNQKRGFGYCFTINNPTAKDLDEVKVLQADPKVRYLCYGKEVGENGTPHYQGYIYFHYQTAFTTVKKFLTRAHYEISRGSPEQNREYCSKDGEFFEYGELPMSRKRKGEVGKEWWDNQKDLAKKGKLDEVDSKLFLYHYRTLRSIQKDYADMPQDADGETGVWYWGQTGTGKSRKARGENPGAYLKMCNKWWDGYLGEDIVIMEDFDKNHSVLGHHLKIWADRYAFPAEVKGGKVNIRPKKIIITSNWHPSDIWGNEPETLEPIKRRFTITHFNHSINTALGL